MNFISENLNVSRDEVQGTSHYVICYIAEQMGQNGGKQVITLLTNDVEQRSTFRG